MPETKQLTRARLAGRPDECGRLRASPALQRQLDWKAASTQLNRLINSRSVTKWVCFFEATLLRSVEKENRKTPILGVPLFWHIPNFCSFAEKNLGRTFTPQKKSLDIKVNGKFRKMVDPFRSITKRKPTISRD